MYYYIHDTSMIHDIQVYMYDVCDMYVRYGTYTCVYMNEYTRTSNNVYTCEASCIKIFKSIIKFT